ncbi:hypothetical protein AB0N05_35020 [Nocardia sp. NPDC051030]|uniref:hypothetical protein n=1 Tax=Nocardia sp. NPDC051030 TaxID=3155162 RepID=UPI00343E91F8
MGIRYVDDYDDRKPTVTVAVSITVNVNSTPLQQEPRFAVTAAPPAEPVRALNVVPFPSADDVPSIAMTLDGGRLPTSVEFRSGWRDRVPPKEVGRELFEAYSEALNERHGRHSAANISAPGWPLSAREQAIMLLETCTWNKYCRVQDDLQSEGEYLIRGAATQYDKAAVSMTGNRRQIHSITVSPLWPGCSNPRALEAEVLWCADQIRALRPKFAPKGDWSHHSDAELFELQSRHRQQLIRNSTL